MITLLKAAVTVLDGRRCDRARDLEHASGRRSVKLCVELCIRIFNFAEYFFIEVRYKFSGASLSFYNSMNIYRSAGKVGQN